MSERPIEFLSEQDVQEILDLTHEDIVSLCATKTLLSLELSSGELCFPVFQFTDGDFDGELISLFQLFPEDWSGWEVTNWFHNFNPYLSKKPIDLIKNHYIMNALRLVISTEITLAKV